VHNTVCCSAAGQQLGSGWAAAVQQLGSGCPAAGRKHAPLFSQTLSVSCCCHALGPEVYFFCQYLIVLE